MDHNGSSTAIRGVNYDARGKVLRVAFTSGAVYDYFGVPRQVYEDFIAAPSRGRFFAYRVRDKFPYRKKANPRKPAPAALPSRHTQ
ncbi:MAG: KTSC domain-containing protein [Rhodospirillaceae bacterium]|nr:KTSC domain-containing protein [Rhodospirillaceae bacterium]